MNLPLTLPHRLYPPTNHHAGLYDSGGLHLIIILRLHFISCRVQADFLQALFSQYSSHGLKETRKSVVQATARTNWSSVVVSHV